MPTASSGGTITPPERPHGERDSPPDFSSGCGLYIHIPFCRSKCPYCDFFSGPGGLGQREDYLQLLIQEMEYPHFLPQTPISSLYYGGGTPSLLTLPEVEQLQRAIRTRFTLLATAEVTFECNPEGLSREYLEGLHTLGINRLSMGVQSLDPETLRFLGRRHGREGALRAMELIAASPFSNYSLDAIYGIPGQRMESLIQTLDALLTFHPPHLSAYHLSLEPSTRFGRMLARGALQEVSEGESEAQFNAVHQRLESHGYDHYEVSNFALEGKYAQHNSGYWFGRPYLGVGASAHSFDGSHRYANPAQLKGYAESLIARRAGTHTEFCELLTPAMDLDEWLMVGLRTRWGIDLTQGATRFGKETMSRILNGATPWLQRGQLTLQDGRLSIPSAHFLLSDAIILSIATQAGQ